MKLTIEQSNECSEVEIHIRCGQIDNNLERLISEIRLYGFSITGRRDGVNHLIKIEEIYYFESIDEKTYIYCAKNVYESIDKLYEVEDKLLHMNFQRISKSCILNVHKLISVKPLLNGKLSATLDNGENLIVNRHYVTALKEKLEV